MPVQVCELLALGAAVNIQNSRGMSPLHIAVSKGTSAAVSLARMLVEAGADLEVCRADGYSVLHQVQLLYTISTK